MVIRTDCAERAAIFGAIRAKVEKLDYAREVIRRSRARNASDFLDFYGKRFLRGSGDERTAVRDKELQHQDQGTNQKDGGHHRGITANVKGAKRASLRGR